MNKPEPGFCTLAKVISVTDGDTIKVELRRTFNVRLKGIDVFELDGEMGKAAKTFVKNLIEGKEVTLFVPSNNSLSLMDVNSFNRIVGEIWVDNSNLRDILQKEGFEKTTGV